MEDLKQWLMRDEGLSLKPYKDTVGKLTIGYGRNLDDVGISKEEAEVLLINDIVKCQSQLCQYDWYINQPPGVKDALVNLCFNIGMGSLLGFHEMIKALIVRDYKKAALEALNSKWATQVPNRAHEVADKINAGL